MTHMPVMSCNERDVFCVHTLQVNKPQSNSLTNYAQNPFFFSVISMYLISLLDTADNIWSSIESNRYKVSYETVFIIPGGEERHK